MQERLAEFNAAQPSGREIGLRIGINSGFAIVGDVGSPQRKDYTCIGDTVNVASRIESSVAKRNQVVIGPGTQARVQGLFEVRPLKVVQLRSKTRTDPTLPRCE